jgi:hypothetical protein
MHSVISVERVRRNRAIVLSPCAIENAGILTIAVHSYRVNTRLVVEVAIHCPVVSRTNICKDDSGFLCSPDTIQSVVVVSTRKRNSTTNLNDRVDIGQGTASGNGDIHGVCNVQEEKINVPRLHVIHAHTPTRKTLGKIAGRAGSSDPSG